MQDWKPWQVAHMNANSIPIPGANRTGHRQRAGDLGPKQLAWCDEHIIGFRTMREQAAAARKHAAEIRAKMRGCE